MQCNQLSRSLVQVEPPDGFAQFLSHGKNCFPSGQNLPRRSQKGRALCPWTNSHSQILIRMKQIMERKKQKLIQNQFAENESDRSKVGKVMARKSGKE